MIFLHLFIIK